MRDDRLDEQRQALSGRALAMNDPVSFGLAVVALLAVPGPTNTLLFTAGATVGLKRAAYLLFAEVIAYNLTIFTLLEVFTRLFSTYGMAHVALRVLAAGYLFLLARRLWTYEWSVVHAPIAWRNVFSTTLLNPKAVVFAFLVFPANSVDLAPYFAGFSLLTLSIGMGWMSLGHFVGGAIGQTVRSTIPRLSSGVIMGFAVLLLASLAMK